MYQFKVVVILLKNPSKSKFSTSKLTPRLSLDYEKIKNKKIYGKKRPPRWRLMLPHIVHDDPP